MSDNVVPLHEDSQRCARPDCEAVLRFDRRMTDTQVAERIREAGWFIEQGRGLVCGKHL